MTDQPIGGRNGAAADVSEWRAYIGRLAPIGDRMLSRMADPGDPQLRQELYRFLFQEISRAYVGLFLQDAEYPVFWPIQNMAFNVYGPNPDYIYNIASLDGRGIYRLSGFRGTVRFVDFQFGDGELLTLGRGLNGRSLGNHEIDELVLGEDGSFEVLLSEQRPAGHQGDWWQLEPAMKYIYMRQGAYDWTNEVDSRVVIERLDTPAIKPRQSAAKIEETIRMISEWAENWAGLQLDMLARDREAGLVNTVTVYDFASEGGTHSQQYVKGQFNLKPDEALILETELPGQCKYWSFALHDAMYTTVDYTYRQSSLNGFQAKIDSDGRFRAVICGSDPGVPNWLDTAGYATGAILGRWRDADSAPRPTATKVRLADVRRHLPADTPVVTPEMRDAEIRRRSRAANLRRKW